MRRLYWGLLERWATVQSEPWATVPRSARPGGQVLPSRRVRFTRPYAPPAARVARMDQPVLPYELEGYAERDAIAQDHRGRAACRVGRAETPLVAGGVNETLPDLTDACPAWRRTGGCRSGGR